MDIIVGDTGKTTAEAVMRALNTLNSGGLVCLPVHGQYAIVGNVFFPETVERMRNLGLLEPAFPIAVLVHAPQQLAGLAEPHPDWVQTLIDEHWPGPLTIVLEAIRDLPWDLGPSQGTVQLSCPANDVIRQVLVESGPLACISATPAASSPVLGVEGEEAMASTVGSEAVSACNQAKRILETLGTSADVALFIHDVLPSEDLSTIVDGLKPAPTVLRRGAIALSSPHE